MNQVRAIIVICLAIFSLATVAEARGWKDRRDRWKKKRKPSPDNVIRVGGGEAEKPIDWLSYSEAAEKAPEEKRGMMLLFTTNEMLRSSTSCRFAGDAVRDMVRKTNVLPVMVIPPETPSAAQLNGDKGKEVRKLHAEAIKRYRKLVQQFRISQGPCLVLAASDATTLKSMVAPNDGLIIHSLAKLEGLLAAHQAAIDLANSKKDPGKPEKPAGDPAKPEKPVSKPEPKKPTPADPNDDF